MDLSAFSDNTVLIYNDLKELEVRIQSSSPSIFHLYNWKRALGLDVSPGRWSGTCTFHWKTPEEVILLSLCCHCGPPFSCPLQRQSKYSSIYGTQTPRLSPWSFLWCLLVFVILSEDVVFSAWRRFAVDSKTANNQRAFPTAWCCLPSSSSYPWRIPGSLWSPVIAEDGKCNHGYADSGGVSLEL